MVEPKDGDELIYNEESTIADLADLDGADETATPMISLLLYERDGAEVVPLRQDEPTIVGRGWPSTVTLADRSLSRQHARFTLEGHTVFVEDLGSTNGTRVNGKSITKKTRVAHGDEVRIGSVVSVLHVLTPTQAPLQGLESLDGFMVRLQQEITRAKTFRRPVALMMVRAARDDHLSRWNERVRELLRPVDAVAVYAPNAVLVYLAEKTKPEALEVAELAVAKRRRSDTTLLCGIAAFPEDASSAEELVEEVHQVIQGASAKEPIQLRAKREHQAKARRKVIAINSAMRETYETAKRIADSHIPVLIYGETGTGKEVLASYLHNKGPRRGKPLRCINCGAIPEQLVESALFGHERGAFTGAEQQVKGLFEQADGGTVLLDEIGELSASAQTALLRVIETQRVTRIGSGKEISVDVRVVAATHRDLEGMCEGGQFRRDLFYRLSTMVIRIPPLRERRDEILPLAEHFIGLANQADHRTVREIDPAARELLLGYRWPGNVRELRNVIDRAVAIAEDDVITVEDLSERIRGKRKALPTGEVPAEQIDIKEQLRRYEAQLLLDALRANDWNQTRTAKALNMPLRTLVHKIKTHGLRKKYESG